MNEVAITLLAGGLLIPLLQILKRAFHLKGSVMRWIVVGLSLIAAFIISIISRDGGFAELIQNPELILTGGGAILGVATLFYGAIKEKMNLSEDNPS